MLANATTFHWWLLLGVALTTFGAGFCGPNLQRMAMEASKDPMGAKMAVYSTGISLTGMSMSALVAHLNTHIWNEILLLMLGLLIAAILLHFLHQRILPLPCHSEQPS